MTDTIATYLMMLLRMSIQIQAQGKHLACFTYYENVGRVVVQIYPNAPGHTGPDWHNRPGLVKIRSAARVGMYDSTSRTQPFTESEVIVCLERAATQLKAYIDGSLSDPIQEARHAA